MKTLVRVLLLIVAFVVAVNLIWWVAPVLGDPGVYRPLFAILLILVGSAVWRQIRGES